MTIIHFDEVPVDLTELADKLRARGFKVSRRTLYRRAVDGRLRITKAPTWLASVGDYLRMIGAPVPTTTTTSGARGA